MRRYNDYPMVSDFQYSTGDHQRVFNHEQNVSLCTSAPVKTQSVVKNAHGEFRIFLLNYTGDFYL